MLMEAAADSHGGSHGKCGWATRGAVTGRFRSDPFSDARRWWGTDDGVPRCGVPMPMVVGAGADGGVQMMVYLDVGVQMLMVVDAGADSVVTMEPMIQHHKLRSFLVWVEFIMGRRNRWRDNGHATKLFLSRSSVMISRWLGLKIGVAVGAKQGSEIASWSAITNQGAIEKAIRQKKAD
ncbi:hypothetical protein Nepgr_004706 [Nepenthes gracilis]|uniref:Uncharacterized protein n=1 Tax=Nepenthes gracilis TaxID=150966 RepID=A0AAD3S226_NEPGR|nr:hypothetical protein Nepgr_004706 [Nepenthes gracilis]